MAIKNRKARASTPISAAQTLVGRVSWFGGPNDPSSGPTTASGLSVDVPGMAVYNQATLRGYWKVHFDATGRTVVLQQTDIGPAPWTGRVADITYSALAQCGFSQDTFPTDSTITITYLGTDKSGALLAAGQDPVSQGGAANPLPQSDTTVLADVPVIGQFVGLGDGLIKDAVKFIADTAGLVVVEIVKNAAIGIGDYILIPWWHWNQRIAAQYTNDAAKNPEQAIWTGAFWSLGYVLLFTDPTAKNLKPAPVHRSRLAHHTRHLQALPARRALIAPKHVRERTPKKPKEIRSAAPVMSTGTLQVTRPRPVKVINGSHPTPAPVRSEISIEPEGAAPIHAAPAKSDTSNSARNGTPKNSRGNPQTTPSPRGANGDRS